MKFLLVLLVVLAGVWMWRRGRDEAARERAEAQARQRATPAAPPDAAAMVACAHCGLHLPLADAVAGQHGHYCCADHRRQREP